MAKTKEEYDKMLAAQNGVCKICLKPEATVHKKSGTIFSLSVDHNHTTGKVRSLLCRKCNLGIAQFNESTEDLMAAILYLKSHGEKNEYNSD